MYYNTTKETGNDLETYKCKASNQDETLLNHFKNNRGVKYSASELWINLFETETTPLTSCRRSLNTLKELGLIDKLDDKKTGIYGRPENLWVLKGEQLKLF